MTDQNSQLSNVLKFRALVDSDPALQEEVRQHVGIGSWDATAIVKLGHARGLDFSESEIVDMMEEDDELSDFELEMVAAAAPDTCSSSAINPMG